MVDIFDEVDEDLRAERAKLLVKRYSGAIAAVGLLIVAAAVGWQGWRWWDGRRDEASAASYLSATSTADKLRAGEVRGRAAAGNMFAQIASGAPAGYAALARLRAAVLLSEAGDDSAAAALWNQVAADRSGDPLLRDLASLNWAQHQLGTGDPAVLEARLKPLQALAIPWHSLALEAEALLDIRIGRTDPAKEIFRGLTHDASAPGGLRGRANGLLNRLGG